MSRAFAKGLEISGRDLPLTARGTCWDETVLEPGDGGTGAFLVTTIVVGEVDKGSGYT